MSNSFGRRTDVNYFVTSSIAVSAIFMALGFLQLANREYLFLFYFFAVLIALLCGYVCVKVFKLVFKSTVAEDSINNLLVMGAIMLISVLFSSVVYYFADLNFYFMTFHIAFLIPYLFILSLDFFLRIPSPECKLWYYPVDEAIDEIKMIDAAGSETVKFVLRKNMKTVSESRYTVNTPGNIPVGKLFSNLIFKYNREHETSIIEYADNGRNPVGWIFYKTSFFSGNVLIDPDSSFYENSMRPNQTVYAVRKPDSGKLNLSSFF